MITGYYEKATICLNGHVISSSEMTYTDFCQYCGKETVSHCSHCSEPIRGKYVLPNVFVGYTKPSYCFKCGTPFPWTEQLINNAVEIVSLDEKLSDADKEIIKNAFPDLVIETPSSPVAIAKYRKLIPKASTYVQQGLKNLFVDVVSETIKKSLFD